MAKRFTDTGKWAKPRFADLSLKMKLVWIYLCDNCDHAGVWDINLKLLIFHIGEPVSIDEIREAFGDWVKPLSATKIFLDDFVQFQYGNLNPENRVHKSILDRVKKEGAKKGLVRSLKGSMDMDMEMDKENVLRGSGGKTLDALYAGYPRKKGKSAGMKTLKAAIKRGESIEDMFTSCDRFKEHHKNEKTAAEFVPYFSTWASSYRDCLDPDYGKSDDFSEGAGHHRTMAEILADQEKKKNEGAA